MRERYEARWTAAAYDALTRALAGVPVHWRYFVKHRIFEIIEARDADEDGAPEAVDDAFAQVLATFPQLRFAMASRSAKETAA
jgi:N-methylhydantoinase B